MAFLALSLNFSSWLLCLLLQPGFLPKKTLRRKLLPVGRFSFLPPHWSVYRLQASQPALQGDAHPQFYKSLPSHGQLAQACTKPQILEDDYSSWPADINLLKTCSIRFYQWSGTLQSHASYRELLWTWLYLSKWVRTLFPLKLCFEKIKQTKNNNHKAQQIHLL